MPGLSHPQHEKGFILVLVIWIAVLLALLVTGFSFTTRSHLQMASATAESAKAEALADAGIQIAVLALASVKPDDTFLPRIPINGTAFSCDLDGSAIITLRVQNEAGRVNLNLAGERLLLAFFIGLGASREEATRYANAVIDYRDPDDNRRQSGAEFKDYEAAGLPLGPKNAPFETVDELNRVLGLDPAIVAAAQPYLTVFSTAPGVDPRAASADLLQKIRQGDAGWTAMSAIDALSATTSTELFTSSSKRVFTIKSTAQLPGGAAFARHAIVDIDLLRSGVPLVRLWRRGVSEPAAVAKGEALSPC